MLGETFVAELEVAFIGRLSSLSRVTSCHEIWDDTGINAAVDSLQSCEVVRVVSLHHEASSVVENISSLELLLFKIKVFLI